MLQLLVSLAVVASTLFTFILISLPSQYRQHRSSKEKAASRETKSSCDVQVLVLGDIGRSPRMQYHALSIAQHGGTVQLIGYIDSEPLPELQGHPNVTLVPLPPSPRLLQTSNKLLFLILAPLKVLLQVWSLWFALGYRTTPSKWMLVQNPPSIPTLLIASMMCFLRHTRLIIDWHNFGYSILAMKLGSSHPLVIISRIYEHLLARTAYTHFAVTDAMCDVLRSECVTGTSVFALHDRPAALFQPLAPSDRIAFLSQHPLTTKEFSAITDGKLRLIVSSTSWTADEDFSVLLEALCQYSASATSDSPQLPELLVVITGKGPQQTYYLRKIEDLKVEGVLEMVTVKTSWLSFEDYSLLLGSADLGVSLHTSSSGVDLPMKVVDMFGSGLPVLGFNNFKAWSELVTEGVDGRGFSTSEQMTDILKQLLDPQSRELETLRRGALEQSKRRWSAEWDSVAGRLLELTN